MSLFLYQIGLSQILHNLKNLLKILIVTLILFSCKEEAGKEMELVKSDFNLRTDITDFKKKMTELDTINIWFDHSVCTYEGVERIEITKETDLIKIQTVFREDTFDDNPEWKIVYEKRIPTTDTIWKIEEFFERNMERQKSEEKEYGTLQVSHNGIKAHYFTNGLVDLNGFMTDYFKTMKKLHPENIDNIYGVEILEESKITN